MPRPVRTIAACFAGTVVFGLLAVPSFRLHLLCRRELYRFAELTGVMDTRGPLAGQILGHNYQREPAWVHWPVGGIGAAVGFAPALAISLVAVRAATGSRHVTLCGRCGAPLRGLPRDREPRCPLCGSPL